MQSAGDKRTEYGDGDGVAEPYMAFALKAAESVIYAEIYTRQWNYCAGVCLLHTILMPDKYRREEVKCLKLLLPIKIY